MDNKALIHAMASLADRSGAVAPYGNGLRARNSDVAPIARGDHGFALV